MKPKAIIFILFLAISCKTVQEPICQSSLESKFLLDNVGLKPIEILPHNKIIRVWIDGSSSLTDVLTIILDDTGNYAEFVRFGFAFKKRIIGKKFAGRYEQTETCPSQGWENFLNSIDLYSLSKMESRIFEEEVDPAPMDHPITTYLIEIKIDGEQKKIEFFTFYPSQSFAENMMEYKKFEKLILTSFPPLLEKLRNDQKFYNYRLNYEY
jgi:hypothetical protein